VDLGASQRAAIALAIALVAAASFAVRAAPGEDFYRYTDAEGRTVYTNIAEHVPAEQRAAARIDLSKVELNSELARELDERFEREHAVLRETPYCTQALAAAQPGVLEHVWDEHAPLLVCGGVLLLFAFLTPSALKRYGAPVWSKILVVTLPMLAVVTLVGLVATRAQRTVSALKARAAPCEQDAFAQPATAPNPLLAHQALLERLRRDIEQASSGHWDPARVAN
jgi:hypothetical protein